jgi:hypothetical protein
MAKVATPKQTGGGGFNFEDKATAYFLAKMLSGGPPLGPAPGNLLKIAFQARPDGWLLDDLLLTLDDGQAKHMAAASAKSNRHITGTGVPAETLKDIWNQFLNIDHQLFDQQQDYLLFIVAPLARSVSANLTGLIKSAQTGDPAVLAGRLNSGTFSQAQLALFNGFACPVPWKTSHKLTAADTFRLLSRIILLEFDFQDTASQNEMQVIAELCQVLRSRDQAEAVRLYRRLCAIRGEIAPHGGQIDRQGLLKLLIADFELSSLPQYDADWKKIGALTAYKLANIPDKIGGRCSLIRTESMLKLAAALNEVRFVYLTGRSGFGKTVLAKELAARTLKEGRQVIWLDADLLQYPSLTAAARLSHPIEALLAAVHMHGNLIVVDGADRLFKENLIDHLMPLIRQVAALEPPIWKMVITCQSEDYEALLKLLYHKNMPFVDSRNEEIGAVTKNELLRAAVEFPPLIELFKHEHLLNLLGNLKYLDLVAFHLSAGNLKQLEGKLGETALVDWIWQQEISDNSSNGSLNSRFLQELAGKQAEQLSMYTPVTDFSIPESAPVAELKKLKLIGESADRLYFIHDLFGDWARYKIIRAKGERPRDYLLTLDLASPLWNKAIRLFGIYLLEKEASATAWLDFFNSFSAAEPRQKLVRSTLLEGVIFSNDTLQYLENLWPELQKKDGELMNQFLERFLARATMADQTMLKLAGTSAGMTVSFLATNYRAPIFGYWFPVLAFIKAHADELMPHSRGNCLKTIRLWLEKTAPGSHLRHDMAAIAVKCAQWLFDEQVKGTMVMGGAGEDIYGLMLHCYSEFPEEVADLSLKLARRRKFRDPQKEKEARPWHPMGRRSGNLFRSTDMPFEHVDRSFQKVCLENSALSGMISENPALAREILLALLLKEQEAYEDSSSETYGLVDMHWFPPFYTRGPFNNFLMVQATTAVQLIIDLTNVAVENWRRDAYHQERMIVVTLPFADGSSRSYFGDGGLYFWFRDSGNAPHVLSSALMALEKFLLDELKQGREVTAYIDLLLTESVSVAMLGLLASVGKAYPELFTTQLKPLLAEIALLHWEMTLGLPSGVEGLQMTGSELLGIKGMQLAAEWNNLPQRRTSLRHVAQLLFFNKPEIETFYKNTVVPGWIQLRAELEAKNYTDPFLDNMISQFDRANYVDIVYEGRQGLQYQEPEKLTEKLREIREESVSDERLDGFSFRIYQALEKKTPFTLADLEQIWTKVRGYFDKPLPKADNILNRPADNLLAAIAVLLYNEELLKPVHADYLEWAMVQLEGFLASWKYDLRHMASIPLPQSADNFCAFIVPILYKRNPDDERTRRMVCNLLLKAKHPVITDFFKHLAAQYRWYDERSVELQNLYTERCHLTHNLDVSVWDTSKVNFKKILAPLHKKFMQGKVERTLIDLAGYRVAPKEGDAPKTKRRHQVHYAAYLDVGVDVHGLYQAYSALPQLGETGDAKTDQFILQLYRSMINLLTFCWGPITDDRLPIDEWTNEFDKWLAFRLAKTFTFLDDIGEGCAYWEPLMAYGNLHHKWLEEFCFQLVYANLETSAADRLGWHWNAMIDRAFRTKTWGNERRFRNEASLWESLLAISDISLRIWDMGYKQLLEPVKSQLVKWFGKQIASSEQTDRLCRLLLTPCGVLFVAEGIQFVNLHLKFQVIMDGEEVPKGFVRMPFKHYDRVASMCAHLWATRQSLIIGNEALFKTFKEIVIHLVAIQNPTGLELQDRLMSL